MQSFWIKVFILLSPYFWTLVQYYIVVFLSPAPCVFFVFWYNKLLMNQVCFNHLQAYTSQFVSLIMFGLMMSEDRLSMQQRRLEIINGLKKLPGVCVCVHVFLSWWGLLWWVASCSSLTSVAWPGCLKSPTSVSPCSRIKSTHCSTTRGAMWSPYLLSYRTVSSNLWPNTPVMIKYRYRVINDRPLSLAFHLILSMDMCWNSERTHNKCS